MRVIVYGLGAVGGSVAAALTRKGHNVLGVARGTHLSAIRESGLRFRAPGIDERVPVQTVADPSEIRFAAGDMVLLAMKTQDTPPALDALRGAGMTDQPLFCFQNGVSNERLALRLFPNVHGVTVMMPSTHLQPGEVAAFGQPCFGLFDIGRYPHGVDQADRDLADMLTDAGFGGFPVENVMSAKYGKLLLNLGNILKAAIGNDPASRDLSDGLRAEAMAVYEAAGIDWHEVGGSDPRRDTLLRLQDVPGVQRGLGSTTQSLARGLPLETDYLNGEITLLGRLHGVPTPLNAACCRLAARLSAQGTAPGSLGISDLRAALENGGTG